MSWHASSNGYPPSNGYQNSHSYQPSHGYPQSNGYSGQMSGGYDHGKTQLWMGDLEPWMDEPFLQNVWFQYGETVNVKIIRDKTTGQLAGYCFVDFGNPYAPPKYIASLNGMQIPGTNKCFKLGWASGAHRERDGPSQHDRGYADHAIFVGDLGPEVNEYMLLQLFQSRYASAKNARVVTDPSTGMPKGYGFVRFTDEAESIRAMAEMNGVFLGSRAIRCSAATNKKSGGSLSTTVASVITTGVKEDKDKVTYSGNDPMNTTIFVGGMDQQTSESDLRRVFQAFGEMVSVKIPSGQRYGFIQFATHQMAGLAIQNMNGGVLGQARIRVAWGHTTVSVGQTPLVSAMPVVADVVLVDPLVKESVDVMNERYIQETAELQEI